MNALCTIDTAHEDMIHDSQFDYYSTKLATASSDKTVKIFDVKDESYHHCATLTGHQGPVWQVAWAHPKFGVLLASCSYDGRAIIYRESPQNQWTKVYEHKLHEFSINSISWAPHEHGLILACASSDGKVSTLQHNVDTWILESFSNDNQVGCNSISWAPFGSHDALRPPATAVDGGANASSSPSARRFVTGSCDSLVRFWRFDESTRKWAEEAKVANPHTDWVRDTAWAPGISLPYNLVASCSEDKTVMIWKDNGPDGKWVPTPLPRFEQPVWRVSWSVTGNVLAVSSGNPSQPTTHEVTLWKQTTSEEWVQMSKVNSGK